MAIKKKGEDKGPQLPAKLAGLLTKAFGEQFLKDKFEKNFKETKGEIEEFLNTDSFDIEAGKSVKCAEGSFYYTERNTVSVNKDSLIDMIEAGEISVAQVLACVSTFKNEELEKAISSAKFKEISETKTSSSLTLKANAEYKAKLEADFSEGGFKDEKKVEEIEEVEEVEEVEVIDVKKLKKAKSSKKSASVDDDLDSILNS